MAMLDEIGVLYRVASVHQIKLPRGVSYYPGKGTIHVDGERGARPERGLVALREVILERGLTSKKRS